MRNFTIEDFSGAGQYLIRMSPEEIHKRSIGEPFRGYSNTGYLSTIMYKVGWLVDNYKIGNGEQITALISMADGMIKTTNYTAKNAESNNYEKVIWQGSNGLGKQLLCDWLNNNQLSEEYRFATQEEVVRVVLYQKHRWRDQS
jgi:hypothetical protein